MAAYFSLAALRRTLRVGVSSPVSWLKSCGRMWNFLIDAYDGSLRLTSSMARPIS